MTCYIDASALLPMLVREAASPVVDAFIGQAREPFVVSEFASAEVASALSRLVRTQHIAASEAADCLADFDAWRAAATQDIDVQASDVRLADVYVRRFDLMLRTPDALHAALCRRANLRLITLDRGLAVAARELGVTVELLSAA